jgi:hypothetical protein
MRRLLFAFVLLLYCNPAAAADPPTPSGSGSPVLERIFANWKDDHVCAEFREWPSLPHAKWADKPGIVGRQAFNGQLESRFWVSQSEKLHFVPEGWIHPTKEQSDFGSRQFTPLLLTYRTLHPWLPWRVEDCRLITENAIIDGVRYVKIEQTVKDNGVRTVDTCWVDPRRDDVVVAWERRPNGGPSHPTWHGSCEYQKDPTFGWVPHHWRVAFGADTYLICESTVTAYDLNQPVPPQKFDPHFPAGTYVTDAARREWYFVQPDGSKRLLTHDEFRRLTTPVPISARSFLTNSLDREFPAFLRVTQKNTV